MALHVYEMYVGIHLWKSNFGRPVPSTRGCLLGTTWLTMKCSTHVRRRVVRKSGASNDGRRRCLRRFLSVAAGPSSGAVKSGSLEDISTDDALGVRARGAS